MEAENRKEKALILLLGGIDSTVAAYLFNKKVLELHGLTYVINKIKLSNIEMEYAKITASKLGIKHTVVDLSSLVGLLNFSNKKDVVIKEYL